MLSKKQLRVRRLYYNDSKLLSRKLVLLLLPITHYVVFSETLKCLLKRAIKLTKVLRTIRFEIKAMLNDYYKFNTN